MLTGETSATLPQVLTAARDLLAAGWHHASGAHNDDETAFSATGAIGRAINNLGAHPPLGMIEAACQAVMNALGEAGATGDYLRLALWNNAPERTLQDVLDAFDTAIAAASDTKGTESA